MSRLHIDLIKPSAHHFPAGGFNQAPEALAVSAVDDLSPVLMVLGGSAIRLLDLPNKLLDKLISHSLMHHYIIRSNADLATVQILRIKDAIHSGVQFCRGVDQHGALAPELKRHRSQILGGGFHDDPADAAVACVENVVPLLGQERGGLRHGAQDDLVALIVHIPLDNLLNHLRGSGGHLGRLENHRAPRGHRRGQRLEAHREGEIPRGDIESNTLGLRAHARGAAEGQREGLGGSGELRGCPLVDHF
mmetsp:Transcript_114829/g.263616  ORF Transcript_114829/g.263616 Transcript_114829/m.263616 type:complete len:248 (-) Transcript_114829:354-1097(-)